MDDSIVVVDDLVGDAMVQEVLDICPHVPRRVVVADLRTSLSAHVTINRILDGTIFQVKAKYYHGE